MLKRPEVGDLVVLKSGGPIMTVTSVSKNAANTTYCTWFAGSKPIDGMYPLNALDAAPDKTTKK